MGSVTGQSGRKVKRMRLIDADALEKEISVSHSMTDDYGIKIGYEICMRLVEDAPTIEPQRKTGKWIDYSEDGYVECPFCHSATNCDDNIDELHFCFSCGARLEVQDEAD